MELCESQFLVVVLIALMSSVHSGYLPTFFMDEWCSTTLDMSVQGVEAGRLLLRPPERGMRYLTCFLFFKAPPGRRLSFSFRAFDIQSPYDCNVDHLQLYDDKIMMSELTGRMCNSGQNPSGVYTSTGQEATLKLYKKNYLADQIELIFTSFHLAPCQGGEFKCGNSHCIAKDLYCNDYDNCGDESDICFLNAAGIAGVVIAVIVVVIIIAIILAVVLYRRQQHRRLEKLRLMSGGPGSLVLDAEGRPVILNGDEHVHYVDAWEKKSHHHHHQPPGTPSTNASSSSRPGSRTAHHHHHHLSTTTSTTAADNSAYEDTSTLPRKKPAVFTTEYGDTIVQKRPGLTEYGDRDSSLYRKSSSRYGGSGGGGGGRDSPIKYTEFGDSVEGKKNRVVPTDSFRSNGQHSAIINGDDVDGTIVKRFVSSDYDDSTTTTKKKKKKPSSSSFKSDKKKQQQENNHHHHNNQHQQHQHHHQQGSVIHFGPLETSTLKKSRSENSLKDLYSVPMKKQQQKKRGLFGGLTKRKSTSSKRINDPDVYQQNLDSMGQPVGGMFERNPSFREGMKGEGHSSIPIHTLDPSSLPSSSSSNPGGVGGGYHQLQSPDVYDHVVSFRSYPSPEPGRREKVVYLYPGHPGYHRLYTHGHEDYLLHGAGGSLHSSRSSLVKL